MGRPGVLVVAETPSLGRSIADLLEAGAVQTRLVYDVSAEHPLSTLSDRFGVVISACNGRVCATARRWAHGDFSGVAMVVVGSRDAELSAISGIEVVPLPLLPGPFLVTVNHLLASADPSRSPAASTS